MVESVLRIKNGGGCAVSILFLFNVCAFASTTQGLR